ncbi:hypothetical protein K461DRAFT_293600 [Myriangium duriaei CBS 260.36]|uniref:Uncharacterized protein n=1 Tax=Myriangium duriaei CBS 260.36 TaxID=1168546 RepID=A0A9P4J1A3_9PEZI|nr:hypothetical protein K461DRAFT_293600 [Myriangium duriaei CBS 260.36]
MSLTIRRTLLSQRLRLAPTSLRTQQIRLASGDYGSPGHKDDPAADPQKQGSNPSADKEHPGPPAPEVGQGTGGGPTKASKDGHNTSTKQDPKQPTQQQQKRGFHTSATAWAEKSKDTKGAQPKILSDAAPSGEQQSEDVKRHNEEFAKRADKPIEKVRDDSSDGKDEKVGKGFWGKDSDGKPSQG